MKTLRNKPTSLDFDTLFSATPLPALPESAVQVLEICNDPDMGSSDLAGPIEDDDALTLQLLKFVNSPYFGFRQDVTSVKQGIIVAGVRTIRNFVLWSAVFSATPKPKCGIFSPRHFHCDSLRRALFAKAIGESLGATGIEEIFTAAMLQDIAVPFIARELSDSYAELFEQRDHGRVRMSQLEQESFGWTHADAACVLFSHWKLPPKFGELVQSHIDIEELIAEADVDKGKLAVALSSLVPSESDQGWYDRDLLDTSCQQLGIETGPDLENLLANVDAAFNQFAQSLNISKNVRSLAGQYTSHPVNAGNRKV